MVKMVERGADMTEAEVDKALWNDMTVGGGCYLWRRHFMGTAIKIRTARLSR